MTSRVVIPVLENLEQNRNPLVKTVVKGIKQIQTQSINSQSNSLTQTSFNFQPPSQNTVIDRRFELELPVTLTGGANAFSQSGANQNVAPVNAGGAPGTANANNQRVGFRRTKQRIPCSAIAANGANGVPPLAYGDESVDLMVGNNFAPSQFPLTSCMDSIDLVINGTHFSVSVNQYIHAVMAYTTPEWRDMNLPQTPHAPDTTSLFSGADVIATARNPLSLQGEGIRKGEQPRGAYLSTASVSNNGGDANAVIAFAFREPLFISPLMAMLGHGLTNVNQLDITIRWSANPIRRMFKYFNPNVIAPTGNGSNPAYTANINNAAFDAYAVSFGNASAAKLHVRYYTAQDDVDIPNEIVLPYKQPQIETLSLGNQTGAGGVIVTANGNNVRLNQIPEAVYVYVGQRQSNRAFDGQTYARITSVNIRWKNQTGILSGFDEVDLAELAIYNGYDAGVEEAITTRGVVLKLNYGQDIPLDDNETPGTRGDYNWQMDVSYTNCPEFQAPLTANDVVLYQIFVLNGHAIVSPNECRVATGVLSLEDNMSATDMGHSYEANEAQLAGGSIVGGSAVGGSLIGSMTQHLKKAYNVGKAAVDVGKGAMAAYQDVKQPVEALVSAYKSRA